MLLVMYSVMLFVVLYTPLFSGYVLFLSVVLYMHAFELERQYEKSVRWAEPNCESIQQCHRERTVIGSPRSTPPETVAVQAPPALGRGSSFSLSRLKRFVCRLVSVMRAEMMVRWSNFCFSKVENVGDGFTGLPCVGFTNIMTLRAFVFGRFGH